MRMQMQVGTVSERQCILKKMQHVLPLEIEIYDCIYSRRPPRKHCLARYNDRIFIYCIYCKLPSTVCTGLDESARRVIIGLIKITTISIPAGYQRRYSVTSQSGARIVFSRVSNVR